MLLNIKNNYDRVDIELKCSFNSFQVHTLCVSMMIIYMTGQ